MPADNNTTISPQSREDLSNELKRQALEFSQRVLVKRTEAIKLAKAHQDELRHAVIAETQARRFRTAGAGAARLVPG